MAVLYHVSANTKEILTMITSQVKASSPMKMVTNTKANSKIIKNTVMVSIVTLMVKNSKETTKKTNVQAEASSQVLPAKSGKVPT